MTTKTYETIFEYVKDADISHYEMAILDPTTDIIVTPFSPSDDGDFVIDYDDTVTINDKVYVSVNWGEDESSYLNENAIDDQCYIRYHPDDEGYVSDGRVYETREEAETEEGRY